MKLVQKGGRWKRICSTLPYDGISQQSSSCFKLDTYERGQSSSDMITECLTTVSQPISTSLGTVLPPKEPLGCYYENGLEKSLDLGSFAPNPEFNGATNETNWHPIDANTAISICSEAPTVTEPSFTRTTGNRNIFDNLFSNTSHNEETPFEFQNIRIEDLLNMDWNDN